MTQHYPTTSVWASGPSFTVSAMLLIYIYSLLPAKALSKTLLFVLCLLHNDSVGYVMVADLRANHNSVSVYIMFASGLHAFDC